MLELTNKLFKASDLRNYIKERNLKAFNLDRDRIFFKVLKLIKNSAEHGFSDCRLSYELDIAYGAMNRMYIKKEYIPLFFIQYSQTFLDSGYDIHKLGNHSIVIGWRSNKNESEDDS